MWWPPKKTWGGFANMIGKKRSISLVCLQTKHLFTEVLLISQKIAKLPLGHDPNA
jgi:hypothetical protein